MWNERYSTPDYAYGTEPNDFLASVAARIPARTGCCRSATARGAMASSWPRSGTTVTSVDASTVGLAKAQRLAATRGVQITTVVADLADFVIAPDSWQGIVSIFCHLPPPLRQRVHEQAARGLAPGGLFVLESYSLRQLGRGTGGPSSAELLPTLDALRAELAGLELLHAIEIEREVHEGEFHQGLSAVVQIIARKRGRLVVGRWILLRGWVRGAGFRRGGEWRLGVREGSAHLHPSSASTHPRTKPPHPAPYPLALKHVRLRHPRQGGRARAGHLSYAARRGGDSRLHARGHARHGQGAGSDELAGMNAQMILANAYHLHLRPGDELVRALGGVHRFMGWHGPVLTDSGGFQVFSLASLNKVNEDGVTFRSHIDGSARHFTPESVMRIETNLGADVIMQFDHVIPGQSDAAAAHDASERSIRWLARCRAEFDVLHAAPEAPRQSLFPIVQGGIHANLRRHAARAIAGMHEWDGFAIGGLSVGEAKPDMYAMIEVCDDALPADRPRYLMGVGYPEDLLEGVARGIDMFDCVAPTRMGRNAAALTPDGRVSMRRAPSSAPTTAPWWKGAAAAAAGAFRAPTCGTWSRPTRCWAPACCRCIMYIS